LRSQIARTCHELERLRPAWERLYAEGEHTLFQSYRWNALAARVFGGRERPLAVLAEAEDGVALLPGCAHAQGLRLLGEELFDYRDALCAGDPEIARAAWEVLARERAPFTMTALRGHEARNRWAALGLETQPFAGAPAVRRADADAEQFAEQHSRSARFLRRLTRAGCSLREHPGSESALVRHIYELKAEQAGAISGGNLFADPLRREFMVAIAGAESGCEIFTLESGGTLVSALVTFRDGLVRRFYTIYHDRAWAHESPGVALLVEVTRHTLAEGLDCDYMTGEQPHKTRFATDVVPLYRVQASAPQVADSARAGFREPRAA
jgi:CelD/BcsL family acetyltransferase involved in cellulose biosynthesis